MRLLLLFLTSSALAAPVDFVRACWDNCIRNWQHHFWLHGYDLGPLGRFLHACERWGLDALEVLPLLEGASPSTSSPNKQAAEICRAVRAAGADPATLDELYVISPEIAAAVDRYLQRKQWVLFSRYDVDGVAFGERPELVLAMIMAAEDRDASAEIDALTEQIRQRVAAGERAEFDSLLGSARDAMDLRDDNGPVTAEWPLGLLRRALLAVGAALVQRGLISDRDLALEVHAGELQAASLAELPDEATLRARREARAAQARLDAPWLLGQVELAPPVELLPRALADLVEMVQTVEFAGTVAAVGARVSMWQPGDRVMGIAAGGGYAERIATHERQLLAVPESLDLIDAAAIPEVFLTAWDALVVQGGLTSGRWALVHAGASGVGTAAIQIAKSIGANIAVTCSAGKAELCLSLGADVVLKRSPHGWLADAMATVPGGFDTVLDVVGGEEIDRNLQVVAARGTIVQVGLMGGGSAQVNVGLLMGKRAHWIRTTLRARPIEEKVAVTRRFAAEVLPLFDDGRLKPVIDRRFSLTDIADAHRLMESNANAGKIVIVL